MYKFILFLLISSQLMASDKLSFVQELNLSTDRISALEVISGAGDIDITTHEDSNIKVKATIVSDKYHSMERFKEVFNRDMVFRMDRESQYAVLRGHAKPDLRKNPDIQIHLDIHVPASMDVDIDDGSGDISIANLTSRLNIDDGSGDILISHHTDPIIIDDGSGNIDISDSNGPLSIEDGSGDIKLRDHVGKLDIEDGSGDMNLSQVKGNKVIEDGSGDIIIQNSTGDVDIEDGSGDIKLTDLSGSLVIDDGSGSIYIDALGGTLNIKSAGSGQVYIDGENRTKEFK